MKFLQILNLIFVLHLIGSSLMEASKIYSLDLGKVLMSMNIIIRSVTLLLRWLICTFKYSPWFSDGPIHDSKMEQQNKDLTRNITICMNDNQTVKR